jgi:secreted Zn-dependent insulinase-like peptidase
MLQSLLRAYAYPGKNTHISMQCYAMDTGFVLRLNGFNQHLSQYLDGLITVIDTFDVRPDDLSSWKQELREEYVRAMESSEHLIK